MKLKNRTNYLSKFFALLLVVSFASCGGGGDSGSGNGGNDGDGDGSQTPVKPWAYSLSAANDISCFSSTATDSNGNTYVVGYLNRIDSFTFAGTNGSTAMVSGAYSNGNNAVIAKYSADGSVVWAKSVSTGPLASQFKGVTVDSDGDIYAVGYISGTGSYTFDGTGSTATVSGASDSNAVIVKYSSDGSALWATSTAIAAKGSMFNTVTSDSNGNIYAAGMISGTGLFSLQASTAQQQLLLMRNVTFANALIVKYSSDGSALWSQSVCTPNDDEWSSYNAVSADSSGNIYAVGFFIGENQNSFTFTGSNSSTAEIPAVDSSVRLTSCDNAVIVKYAPAASDNSVVTVEWAKTLSYAQWSSNFTGCSVDSAGNIYAVGFFGGNQSFMINTVKFDGSNGSTVSVTGSTMSGSNSMLVKFSPDGSALWGKSAASPVQSQSGFSGISIDKSDNIYVV